MFYQNKTAAMFSVKQHLKNQRAVAKEAAMQKVLRVKKDPAYHLPGSESAALWLLLKNTRDEVTMLQNKVKDLEATCDKLSSNV